MVSNNVIHDLQEIRTRGRSYWEPFMRKYHCEVICEIGVFKGRNFKRMIKHNPKVAVAVDSWIDDGVISRNDGGLSLTRFNEIYEEFAKSMTDKPFVKIYRDYSFNVVKHFEDEYFDLIYIDADHSYEGCLRDLNDWYPKLKDGGFLIGDDYRVYLGKRNGIEFGVIEAVQDFAKKNGLNFLELPEYGWAILKPNSDQRLDEISQDFKSIKKINWQRNWEPFLRKYACEKICELGVFKGANFLELIKHQPKLAVAVDSWKDSGEHPRKYDDYSQQELDEFYEFFKNQVDGKSFVKVVRDYTVNAAKLFEDEFFDFVYVDADHSTEGCYADILAWYPKVKKGKFLVGHDYMRRFGVIEAVNKFVKENGLEIILLAPSNWMVVKK